MTALEVLDVFQNIRRGQRAGIYAPHKPLLILLALARVQRGEPRLFEFATVDQQLKQLLTEFGPTSSPNSRHYPFWHLATDAGGTLWELNGPHTLLERPAAATPTLGELRRNQVMGGFPQPLDDALRAMPALICVVAVRILDAMFPKTLHFDIASAVDLDLDETNRAREFEGSAVYMQSPRRKRDSGFRDKVLRAYEYRCCVCGFDMRIGTVSAGLEAAHCVFRRT